MERKEKKQDFKTGLREQILNSAIASFRIEDIQISKEKALSTLKKVEVSLEK